MRLLRSIDSRLLVRLVTLVAILAVMVGPLARAGDMTPVQAASTSSSAAAGVTHTAHGPITNALRIAAAKRAQALRLKAGSSLKTARAKAAIGPGSTPDYFGATPNYANSPLPPVVTLTGGGGTGAVADATVQNGVITSIAVLDGGTNYNASPSVAITSMDGSGAAATAVISPGVVSAISLTSGGYGYTAPTVWFTGGGGTGAAATAALAPAPVSSLTLTNGGTGYTSAPTVTISGTTGMSATALAVLAPAPVSGLTLSMSGTNYISPTVSLVGGGGSGATATASLSPTGIGGVSVIAGGTGYVAPILTITGGGGSGAVATVITYPGGSIIGLMLLATGSGYTSAPTVTITDAMGMGKGAIVTAYMAPTTISGLTLTNPGTGYTSAPSVVISDALGTGAVASATLASTTVSGLTLTNGGSGYTTVPAVTFTGGGGTGAAATAVLAPEPIASLTLTSGGTGYTSAPTVTFTDATGNGASATATITPGQVASISVTSGGSGYSGLRKFVDSLPGLGAANQNDLGQYIPVAVPDTTTYPGSDYYEISLVRYSEQLHKDLPATQLQGYVQTNTSDPNVSKPSYLGPTIVAQTNRPVRIKFTNKLPTGSGGNLFLPVDTTVMGAGSGPVAGQSYAQNRGELHLHGGNTPWISDGTAHQWTTPAGQTTAYPKGVSVSYVPDMWYDAGGNTIASCSGATTCGVAGATTNPGAGSTTFYYTNQQSARLMFYHDHSYGITRLDVYAGEAAGYVLQDKAEQAMVANGTIPADQIPLIIQDKTFVPSTNQLAAEDPTWDTSKWGTAGNLWFPHVYMTNQNPGDISGANAVGRWDYGPWFWPPTSGQTYGTVANPLAGQPGEPALNPGTPNISIVPEAFMDTPLVNGTAYPFLKVGQKAYRFRILNASNDRSLNLQIYFAKSNGSLWDPTTGNMSDPNAGEVNMVRAAPNTGLPADWPTDGRDGGVPDPKAIGPSMVQIGTEGGFLPNPVVLPNRPVGFEYNRRNIVVLNVANKTLFLGPAERADVIVDFSGVPDGAKLILYNDAPAPVPAFDPRYDYYTGDPDQTSTGGAPTTLPGYGPNTRTVMQFQVSAAAGTGTAFNLNTLNTALPAAYGQTQDPPIVPQAAYNAAFHANWPTDAFARIQDMSMSIFNGTNGLTGLTLTNGGSGYTSPPTVTLGGGGGSGAAVTATLSPTTLGGVTLTAPGSGYTTEPLVTVTGGGGSGAVVNASLLPTTLASLALTAGGTGYTSAPGVTFTGGGGSGATATTTLAAAALASLALTAAGSGYTSAPAVTFTGGGGTGASATTTLAARSVASAIITAGGRNYTTRPTVTFTGGGGTGAQGTTLIGGGAVTAVIVTNPGSGYTSAPTIRFTGGNGTGARATAVLATAGIATLTLVTPGSGYTSAPTVGFTGGGGSGATATATLATRSVRSIALTAPGTGYRSAPTITLTGGSGTGATATATLTPTGIGGLTLANPGSGFTTAPTLAFSGGGGTGASGTTKLAGTSVASLTLTATGTGYTSAPVVVLTGDGTGATANFALTKIEFQPKAIQELFDPDYGRMNATMGVEIPKTTSTTQTTIPYGFTDPPTEILTAGDAAAPIGSLKDGTQIWKITHNGVDTHAVHFHLFNVQLINRVGWDGMVTPPDANELGWKDTVRMNPLEDAIVALRPLAQTLPWQLPNDIHPLDVTLPLGVPTMMTTNVDPTGEPAVVTNQLVNFGYDYTWHCHLLGHEENDMMRPMILGVAPISPSGLVATVNARSIALSWRDTSANETGFMVERAQIPAGPWTTVATVPGVAGVGNTVTYTDTTVGRGTPYAYRVVATNEVGYTQTYALPTVGWPHPSFDSPVSNTVMVTSR